MSKSEDQAARGRMEKLAKQINDLRFRYHVLDEPGITDEVYTSLTQELLALEGKYPQFKSKNSPTGRVGGRVLAKFEKVRHDRRMLSLTDAFSFEEIEQWEARILKLVPGSRPEYFCELKFDGLAISLRYQHGELAIGATRGDGTEGENVTQNVKTIHSIPLELDYQPPLEVRGEAVMTKAAWQELNRRQEQESKPLYANTRNAAAGSIRQLDPKLPASRGLQYYAYEIATDLGQKTHEDVHRQLRDLGFKTNPQYERRVSSLSEVREFYEEVSRAREKLPLRSGDHCIGVRTPSRSPRWMLSPMPISSP